jgi:hypothetical protein
MRVAGRRGSSGSPDGSVSEVAAQMPDTRITARNAPDSTGPTITASAASPPPTATIVNSE